MILINKQLLTIGELTAYISCITLAVAEIVNSIEPLLTGISNFKIASRRYNYFFGLDTYKKEGKKLEKVDRIEIKNLFYRYEQNAKLALDNVSFTINKGEKIGIIGKVGSGKTTLMNIIAGFYEVQDNQIYINGIDINEYSRDSIFENIGYAMQKNIIIDDTIKNNIDITNKNTNNDIEKVSQKANLLEDIETMQDGYETKIGENGIKISGGQKQRIAIARALIKDPDIIFADEPTGALDSKTSHDVMGIFRELNEVDGKTIIIVTHDPGVAAQTNRLIRISDGVIVPESSPIVIP